jgi:hypothetical protein
MLKPDDPAWVELVADIKALASGRYVEDAERPSSMFPAYMKSKDGSGCEFSSLHRGARLELLTDADFWLRYEDYGLSHDQQVAIMNNVLQGKPQERWFDGVYDREAETLTLADFLGRLEPDHLEHIQSRGRDGMEMKGAVMPKPDDPVWAKLVADIKAVVSSRGEDELAFSSLHQCEQWDFFKCSGFVGNYVDRGLTEAQVTAVIRNAINGKPQERWLDGVFDRKAETLTLGDILEGNLENRAEPNRARELGGMEM